MEPSLPDDHPPPKREEKKTFTSLTVAVFVRRRVCTAGGLLEVLRPER